MIDLKPCPFCGGKACVAMGFSSDGFHEIITYAIVCTVCDIGIFRPHRPESERGWTAYKTAEEAAEAWNRRPVFGITPTITLAEEGETW